MNVAFCSAVFVVPPKAQVLQRFSEDHHQSYAYANAIEDMVCRLAEENSFLQDLEEIRLDVVDILNSSRNISKENPTRFLGVRLWNHLYQPTSESCGE